MSTVTQTAPFCLTMRAVTLNAWIGSVIEHKYHFLAWVLTIF